MWWHRAQQLACMKVWGRLTLSPIGQTAWSTIAVNNRVHSGPCVKRLQVGITEWQLQTHSKQFGITREMVEWKFEISALKKNLRGRILWVPYRPFQSPGYKFCSESHVFLEENSTAGCCPYTVLRVCRKTRPLTPSATSQIDAPPSWHSLATSHCAGKDGPRPRLPQNSGRKSVRPLRQFHAFSPYLSPPLSRMLAIHHFYIQFSVLFKAMPVSSTDYRQSPSCRL